MSNLHVFLPLLTASSPPWLGSLFCSLAHGYVLMEEGNSRTCTQHSLLFQILFGITAATQSAKEEGGDDRRPSLETRLSDALFAVSSKDCTACPESPATLSAWQKVEFPSVVTPLIRKCVDIMTAVLGRTTFRPLKAWTPKSCNRTLL